MKAIWTTMFLCVSFASSLQSGEQKVVVWKGDVTFAMSLLSPSRLSPEDTLKARFTIRNNSARPIVVLDCDIAGKPPNRRIFFAHEEEISIDLGNNVVLDLGSIRKLRSVSAGGTYSMEFALPMSMWWADKRSRRSEEEINRVHEYVDIAVVAYVAFSDSNEFVDGSLSSLLKFDDYIGPDHGREGALASSLLEHFVVSGITITATH
jgi:hypothetical protein